LGSCAVSTLSAAASSGEPENRQRSARGTVNLTE
jgi:hypothetical protein